MPNLTYWLSYLYVSCMALVGAIYVSYLIKKSVADRVKDYEESSRWGVISDLIMYPVLILYTLATYHLCTLI